MVDFCSIYFLTKQPGSLKKESRAAVDINIRKIREIRKFLPHVIARYEAISSHSNQ